MPPVMICNSSIVLPHSQQPAAQNLQKQNNYARQDKKFFHMSRKKIGSPYDIKIDLVELNRISESNLPCLAA